MEEFHKGDCGGDHFWKATTSKILRDGFYYTTLFTGVYERVSSFHESQLCEGKRKLLPLSLKPNCS